MKKNIPYAALTLALVAGLFGAVSLPANAGTGNTGTETALRSAVSAGGTGDVVLSEDIGTMTEQLTIARSLTLDLNGHILTIDLSEETSQTFTGIKIESGVTLTIMDSASGGILNVKTGIDPSTAIGCCAAINSTDGALIIQSGMVNATGGARGIGGGNGCAAGTITIDGGTVNATGGITGIGGFGGTITISGGIVNATGGNTLGSVGAGIGGGFGGSIDTITISGGTVTAIAGSPGNAAAIGRGSGGTDGVVIISGTYDYWVNTENTAPAAMTGTGAFPYSSLYQYIKLVPWTGPTVVSATPTAFVTKLNGNQNDLTITVAEKLSDGTTHTITKAFSINNNAAGTYEVGIYRVYVDTKGNTQIRACYFVS